jgi:hypothetical protein
VIVTRTMKAKASRATHPPEGAFIVIDGRRWRASDPGIPSNLRQELVNELMSARRAVRDAKTPRAMAAARRRVNDAKLALGERGAPWWMPLTPAASRRRIEAAARALLRSREPGRSIRPSDVAHIVGGAAWRDRLPGVRGCTLRMAEHGHLEIVRRGRVLTTAPTEGVLRFRLPTLHAEAADLV